MLGILGMLGCCRCWLRVPGGDVAVAALLPAGRRLLGLWPGVPVLLGSLSWLGQALPPGWLSRGHVPCGGCQTLQPPGCPSVPSRGGDQTSPGMRVPSGHSHAGLGQGWDSGPAGATGSLHGLFAQLTLHAPPHCPSLPPNTPPPSPPCPFVLCPCPAQGPWGAAPVPVPVPVPAPLSPPRCCCPSVPGGLSVQNRLLQPPRPPPCCELEGLVWGDPSRALWGHCGPTATRDPPAAPGLTPPGPPAPPPPSRF